MTPEDIARYKKLAAEALERANAATEGPWIIDGQKCIESETQPAYCQDVGCDGEEIGAYRVADCSSDGTEGDRRFIAAARQDVPDLAEAVLKLTGALAHQTEALADALREIGAGMRALHQATYVTPEESVDG